MIQLDTSFLIRALIRGSQEDRRLRGWVETGEPLSMSAVAWAELLCGPLTPDELEFAAEVVERRHEFTEEQAIIAARLFNESGRRRGSLPDCMIAAAALFHGAALATANEADFRRLEDSGVTLAS